MAEAMLEGDLALTFTPRDAETLTDAAFEARAAFHLPSLAAFTGESFDEALDDLTRLWVIALEIETAIGVSATRRDAARPIALGLSGLADWTVATDAANPLPLAATVGARVSAAAGGASVELAALLGPCSEWDAVADEVVDAAVSRGQETKALKRSGRPVSYTHLTLPTKA